MFDAARSPLLGASECIPTKIQVFSIKFKGGAQCLCHLETRPKKKRLVVSCMLKSLNFTFEMFFEKKKTINHIKLQAVHLVREGGRVQYMLKNWQRLS